jgi:hypothetical protein
MAYKHFSTPSENAWMDQALERGLVGDICQTRAAGSGGMALKDSGLHCLVNRESRLLVGVLLRFFARSFCGAFVANLGNLVFRELFNAN